MGTMSTVDIRDAEPLAALRALQDQERELAQARRVLIAQARSQGQPWSEIGTALGVSKQAAWELYNGEVTVLLDRIAQRAGMSEDEASKLAQDELTAVRRARRSQGTA